MKTSTIITTVLFGLVAATTVLTVPSCTESQLQRADRIVADVNAVGTGVRTVTDSPGVPAPVRTGGELIGGLCALGVLAWREIRASKILEKSNAKSVTLKAIADGVDQAPGPAAAEVKASIKGVMQAREILMTANAIVDEHRSKLAT